MSKGFLYYLGVVFITAGVSDKFGNATGGICAGSLILLYVFTTSFFNYLDNKK